MASRTATPVLPSDPGMRMVVTPAASESRALTIMRSVTAAVVSSAKAARSRPGSLRPRCTCMFMRPGISHVPAARMTSAPAGTSVPAGPIDLIFSPSISTTAFSTGAPPLMFTTVAPTMAVSFGGAVDSAAPAAAEISTNSAARHPVFIFSLLLFSALLSDFFGFLCKQRLAHQRRRNRADTQQAIVKLTRRRRLAVLCNVVLVDTCDFLHADEVTEHVGRTHGVHVDVEPRRVAIEAHPVRKERHRFVVSHLPRVQARIHDHARRAPQTVAQLSQAYVVALQEALLEHHLFGVQAPTLGHDRLAHDLAQQPRVRLAIEPVDVMPGIGLVHGDDGNPGVVMRAQPVLALLRRHPVLDRGQDELALQAVAERID